MTVTAANTINIEGRTSDGRTSITLDSLKDRGTLFVVIEKKEGNSWYPVTGNALDGWKVSSDSDIASAIKAGQSTNDIFTISTSGSYQAEVDELPGRIQDYVFFTSGSGTYRGSYYYTESDTLSGATSTNTYRVGNSDEFDRQFSAHLYVPNIVNRVLVQKTDETGAPVNGATIALYSEGSVTVEADTGVAKLNENAKPLETAETKTLSKENGDQIDLDGAAIFTKLESGVYWVGELASPDGYAKNTSLAKVIVDDTGVYADAGTDDDGVSVTRGVGRIVRSMVQFAVDDDIDATLHDIVATPQLGVESDGSITWSENEDAALQHLSFSDTNDAVLDYDFEQGSEAYTVEEGIPGLKIEQCDDHKIDPRQEISEDITNLFTGVTIVRITNVPTGDFELSKTVDPATVADSFTFDLEFEQKLPVNNEETGEVALSAATANYIKTLFPGDYEYTITKTDQSAPIEQGTLTIGEATASGENPGGDTSGEGSTEAPEKYIITNVELSSGAGSAYFVASETAGYQVKLAHGETLTINDLPVYTQITATEVKPAGSYLTTVEATPEVTVTEVTASDAEADVDAEGEGNSATDGTETETAVDGENTADGTDGDNTDAATIEGLALDEEESAVTDGEQMTDADEDGGADVSNETVAPQALATSVYTATTIIEKQVAGEAADAPVSYNASIAFTNTQSANATINVQKTLVGTDWTTDKGAYQFTITPLNGAPEPNPNMITITTNSPDSFEEGSETEPTEPTSATVRVGSFGEIAFTGVKVGDSFEYEIKETRPIGTGNGWTYDGHTVKVTVEFEQDETTRELKAVVTYDNTAAATDDDKSVIDAAAFTNVYKLTPEGTESNLTGTKTLNRDFQQDDSFTFDVSAAYAAPENSSYSIETGQIPLPEYVTRTNDGDGNRTDAGTITVDYADLSGKVPNVDFGAITFNLPGTYTYTISEQVPDDATNATLVDAEGNPVLGVDGNPITYGEATSEQQAMAGWALNGVTYDRTSFTVTYEVTDDGDGTMTVAGPDYGVVGAGADDPAPESLAWTNTYKAAGTAALAVTKSIDNRAWQDSDSFEFTLSAGDDATETAVDNGDVVLPSGTNSNPVTVTNSTAGHTATFGAITFNQTGTYTFAITETVPDEAVNQAVEGGTVAYSAATDEQKAQPGWTLDGLTYDNKRHTVTVTVKDNGNGTLTATPDTEAADLTITNSYEASGSLSLAATKQLENDEIAEYDGAFKFTVSVSKADGTSKTVSLGTNDETGAIAFDAIDYTIEKLEDDVAGGYAQRGTDDDGNRTYTYVYTIAEDTSGLPTGVTEVVASHSVTVVVTDYGNGNLTAAVTNPIGYDGGKGLVFENTYGASGKAEITVGGTKTYATAGTTNAPDIAGKYTFTLTGADGAPMPKGAVEGKLEVTNATGGASEDISFGTITYTMDDLDGATDTDDDGKRDRTFTYTVTESGTVEGVDNDSDAATGKTFTVTLVDNGDGTINATCSETTNAQFAFTNTYRVDPVTTEAPLEGTKAMDGRAFQTGDTFTFTIEGERESDGAAAPLPSKATPTGEGATTGTVTITPTSGYEADIDFGTIKFTEPGTYIYTVSESDFDAAAKEAMPNVEKDPTVFTVTYVVTDKGDGTMSVGEPTYAVVGAAEGSEAPAGLAWTNTYDPADATLEGDGAIKVQKTLTGRAWAEGEAYSFTITNVQAPEGVEAPMPVVDGAVSDTITVGAPAEGAVNTAAFGTMTFSQAGTYVYTISEKAPVEGDENFSATMAYDTHVATVTVAVFEDQAAGALWTQVSYDNSAAPSADDQYVAGAAAFTNVQALSTTLDLAGTKTLEGRDFQAGDSFTFTVTADDGAPAPVDAEGNVVSEVTINPTAGSVATVDFGTITFTAAGEYVYRIAEQAGKASGMTYDTVEHAVIVTVTDDGQGNLTAAVAPETEANLAWTNSWTFVPGDPFTLTGTKILTGAQLHNGDFTFLVEPQDNAPMGDSLPAAFNGEPAQNEDGSWTAPVTLLSNITFTAPGDYVYLVSEVNDGRPGYTYDASKYRVTVRVAQDGSISWTVEKNSNGELDDEGNLVWTEAADNAVAFSNSYAVTEDGTLDGSVNLSGTKTLAGRDWIADAAEGYVNDSFTFVLAAGDEVTQAAIDGNPDEGVDPTVVMPAETMVVLQGGYSDGQQVPFSFGDITFKAAGVYTFTIAEQQPSDEGFVGNTGGMAYDSHVRTVVVSVVDNGMGGLTATVVTEPTENIPVATNGDTNWTNTYTPGGEEPGVLDGAANLEVTKVLEGRDWLEGDSFTFVLAAGDEATLAATQGENPTVVLPGNAGGITVAYDAQNPEAAHTAAFGDITFAAEGIYTFTVSEQVPADEDKIPGVTYDAVERVVTVSVTDDLDGTLSARVVGIAPDAGLTFTNTYTTDGPATLPDTGALAVTKALEGRDWLENDSFTFVLSAGDDTTASAIHGGKVVLSSGEDTEELTITAATVDGQSGTHSASFGTITFNEAGIYSFKIAERNDGEANMAYDGHERIVTVNVVDNNKGQLVATVDDAATTGDATFTNVFTAPIDYSARSEIVISKTLDGRPATDGQFSFTVTPADEASALKLGIPEDGYTLSTPAAGDGEKATVNLFATLFGEGKPPVTFTRDDAGTTFSYTVTENGTAPDGYTYDASVYTVDIAVTDDPSAGGLTVTTQVSDGASYTMMTTVTNATEFAQPVEIPFVNSYRASTDVEGGTAAVVNGTKELVGTAMREFSFALEGVAGTNTEGYTNTAVNGEDGSFSFALDYDQDSFTAGATADENGNRSETFVYTLREVGGGDVTGGITYDDARYRVTVTVTDNGDGTMVASVTKLEQRFVDEAGVESWISADAAAFTNTYAAATSVSLDVDKVLSGRDMTAADSYEFVAYAYDRATQTIDHTGLVATGSTPAGQTAADGTPVQVAMSSIEYTIEKLNADTATPWVDVADEAGQPTGARTKTYDYAIEEVVGSDLNISYAPEVFYAQVVVTDDGQGNLTATKAYFADAAMQQPMVGEDGSSTVPTFVNTYLPDATSFHLTGTKTTTFVNVDPGTEPELRFMYDIYLEENGASELVASGWSYANGTVSADIPVTGEGSFTYRIVERYAGTTSGTVTYDDAVYYLTLEVARNADTGIYDFAPTYYRVEDDGTWTQIDAAGLTFANTYDGAAGTTVSLGATKVLEGATFEQLGQLNDKFGFSLYEGDEYTGTKLGEGTITGVDANGNGIVTFPNLTYTFYLQDQPAAETPDEGEQPEGGETAETPGEGGETGQPDGPAEGTEGEVPEGGQTGEGEGGTTVPSDPNAGQPSGEGGATEPDQPAEPSGDAGAVEPTEPVTPEAPAVEPDQPAVDVPAETPSVDEAPAVEGTPEVAPEAPAEDASGDASVQTASIADLFVASEAIADDADAEPFTVDIVDAGAEVAEVADGAADGAAESAADGQAGTSGETAPAAPAEPVIVSDDLGTHVYTIVENVPAGSTQNEDGTWTAPNGVTYDGTKYRVTVEVAASYDAATQKATMTATVTGIARSDSHGSFEDGHATPVDPTNPAASIVFTNSYTARQPVEVSFAGTKNLTGRDMAEGEFSFAVLEGETPVATATNAADGTVSFAFSVATPGTHTYTVVEADGGKGGVDYDTAPRTVTVEVGVSPDGTLAVENIALPEGGLAFNNVYTASGSTDAVIEGTKTLAGRTMAAGEFRFVVTETVDGVETIVAAGENQAPGEDGTAAITFAPISYDASDLGKTFIYQVRELDLGAGGVTYDQTAFTVQVAVVDDLDGTISTEVTYPDGPVAFENAYGTVDGAKVEVTPEATKTLTGRDMADGEFVFTVTDAATGNVVATGANTADGKVVWDAPITLTAKGDYEFAIAEVNGRQDGVTYDDATYRLLVTVADDGEGGLTVESLDYPDGTPAFANSYEEPEKPADPDKPSIPGGPTESVPQTGDDTNLAAAAALGLGGLGAALLGGGALLRRRASR